MGINLNPFPWWTGASWGTAFGLRGKARVGEDALGNVYYEGGADTAGNPRRWVIYNGVNDASRVPPEWYLWMHKTVDALPTALTTIPRDWEKPWVPNLTGTPQAHAPSGSLAVTGKRARATGDYEAWSPE